MNENSMLFTGVTHAWQILALALAVLLATRSIARNRPHIAHALWALVLLKCMTPPVLSSPISPFTWCATALSQPSAHTSARQPRLPPLIPMHSSVQVRINGNADHATAPVPSPTSADQDSPEAAAPPAFIGARTLLIAWASVSIFLLLFTVARLACFLRKVRRTTAVPSRQVEQAAREGMRTIRLPIALQRRVQIRIVDAAIGPAVVGLWKPQILIPKSLVQTCDLRTLQILLAHELTHIRRGDLWWAMLQSLAVSLWWFHPFVWLASRRLTLECERSCDEETILRLSCEPAAYARSLLSVLEQKHQLFSAPSLPGVRPVDVTINRMERIMSLRHGSRLPTGAWIGTILLAGSVAVLPGAAFVVGQESSSSVPASPPDTVLPNPPANVLPNPPAIQPLPQASPAWRLKERRYQLKRFHVGDVLSKMLQAEICNIENQEQALIALLPPTILQPNGDTTPSGVNVQLAPDNADAFTLGHKHPTRRLVGDQLYVFETETQHRQIQAILERYRTTGFVSLELDIKLVTVPIQEFQNADFSWSNQLPDLDSGSTHPAASGVEQALSSFDEPGQPNPIDSAVHSASFVETEKAKHLPPLMAKSPARPALIHSERTDDNLASLLAIKGASLVSAPKICVVSGQLAEIQIGSEHPFVVGFANRQRRNESVPTPLVHTLETGIHLQVQPEISSDQRFVQIDCHVDVSEIVDTSTALVSVGAGSRQEIQIPTVQTQSVHSTISTPLGSTCILSTSADEEPGTRERLFIFVTCQPIQRADTEQSQPNPQADLPSRDQQDTGGKEN